MKRRHVLLGVTGGIAAYKACDIITLLKKKGCDVTVLMTEEAKHFIAPLTLQTLSGNKVFTDMFEPPDEWNPVHTALADKARAIVVAPATANIIGRLAGGICDDILTCVIFASDAPVLIAPAMNEKMYLHRIVQENISALKKAGYRFVGPVKGRLACGITGIGHIAEPETIVKETIRLLK
jgi:phosphopantothenoylcysteine decarboxylase/phosphopantothenate--cysteine ligase